MPIITLVVFGVIWVERSNVPSDSNATTAKSPILQSAARLDPAAGSRFGEAFEAIDDGTEHILPVVVAKLVHNLQTEPGASFRSSH